jgi:hypothetical protein
VGAILRGASQAKLLALSNLNNGLAVSYCYGKAAGTAYVPEGGVYALYVRSLVKVAKARINKH